MMMARYEKRFAHDPTHHGFFERNGTVLGIVFIALVAFWTLFLVVLPYLYMVQESFHPKLVAADRGGPKDILTLEQYRSFLHPADRRDAQHHPSLGLLLLARRLGIRNLGQFRDLLSARLLHGAGGQCAEGAPSDAGADRSLLGERDFARLFAPPAARQQGPDQPDPHGHRASPMRRSISSATMSVSMSACPMPICW